MKRKGSPVKAVDDLESPMESPRGEKLRKSHHLPLVGSGMKQIQFSEQDSLKHECKYLKC